MVKKCLIAIALLAFLATGVHAGDNAENPYKVDWGDRWPWQYLEVEICQIPVYIQIGIYVEVNCDKLEILLKQTECDATEVGHPLSDWPCYYGCTDAKIKTNVQLALSTKWYPDPENGSIIDKKEIKLSDTVVDPPEETIKVCMIAWKPKLNLHEPGDKVRVGEIGLLVKPNV